MVQAAAVLVRPGGGVVDVFRYSFMRLPGAGLPRALSLSAGWSFMRLPARAQGHARSRGMHCLMVSRGREVRGRSGTQRD